ncbi:protein-disulfide reductase DsbD family protein [Muriicola marianensis]|uniref:Thiol:disulfide interchange protein DsbD n=1 Tax=Muriicola marianensis TaxID=1324801 RepID=A0ABQ1QRG3_9FLAO|nr:cytochrome c biogenesis protein CcdA [Muriicola marianensis]GGD40028.1 thiol:disulfide interchange protein DsbD [Muriicola marianensis]
MKKFLNIITIFLFSIASVAQDGEDPVQWTQELISTGEGDYELVMKGTIEEGWHVYSQFTAEGGSLPSEFTYVNAGKDYELVGGTLESETQKAYSEIFEVEETFFKKEAVFRQKVRLLDPDLKQIQVELFYQVCKEVCIPKDEVFYFSLDGQEIIVEQETLDAGSLARAEALKLNLKNKEVLREVSSDSEGNESSLLVIFGLGFLGGLIALLTPCVFPMIPLTVSFFTKKSRSRTKGIVDASLYGFFIILIYFLLSLPFHVFDSVDSQILNTIATNIWLNLFFFLIFVFFAFSFFGYYELTLPSSWANKMDSASNRVGGALGIFFMAVTLAIVSFSCTGPILGGLLGSTALAEGDVAVNLSAGMLGFGVALALPFALFALFPAWLQTLPKSGGWMTTVKVVLGFLELALAFKFLSNADLVGNWGIFKREIFLGIWILIFLLLALYLFGVFRFPHDAKPSKLSGTRKATGLLASVFCVYLLLGTLEVTNLKLLSGFPPPDFYTLAEQESDCPLGINCFKDFESGRLYAQQENKPILLDFTGWACVNCRKMEEHVWSDPEVFRLLNEEFVLISLYVDDRKPLPEEERFRYQFDSGRIKAIDAVGEKWGTFQTINFNAASQPYYVMLSPDLYVLNSSIQNTDSDTYESWLKEGISNFRAYQRNIAVSDR